MAFILEERFKLLEAEDTTDDDDLDLEDEDLDLEDEAEDHTASAETTSATSEPWDQLFKNCKSEAEVNNFWKKYFNDAWEGEQGKQVEKLGATFKKLCRESGFTEETNVIIALLKKLFSATPKIIMTQKDLVSIQKALNNGLLSEADLTAVGDFKEFNIIFHPGFYIYGGGDQVQYLKAQALLADYSYKTESVKLDVLIATFSPAANANLDFIKNLLDGKTTLNNRQTLKTFKQANLILKLIKQLTGKADQSEEPATPQSIKKVVDKLQNKELAKRAVAYIVASYRATHLAAIQKAAAKMEISLDEIRAIRYTEEIATKLDSVLGLGRVKYSADDLYSLLLEIGKIAGMYTASDI